MEIIVIVYSILVLFSWPVDSRKCYECSCSYDWGTNTGTCSSATFEATCALTEVGNQYCFITSSYNGNLEDRVFEAIASNNLQDSHFIQAVEKISLSGTLWLPTEISSISYGCDWDGCNAISLAQHLPESFQMKINQTILSSTLIDGQLPAQSCYSCAKCINQLTAILCKQVSCTNGICFIDEIHNYMTTETNNCTFNFYSYCESFTNPVQTPNIRIRATYYIDLPQEKQLAIDEVDIKCTKPFCNSIEVVEYLKGQVQTTINLHPDFRPVRLNDTTTSTVTVGSTSSTTSRTSTSTSTTTVSQGSTSTTTTTTVSQGSTSTQSTTTASSKSTRSYSTSIFYLIFTLLLLQ